jgi:hypothetical protein
MPTKMAWLSFLRTNQILTLRMKLRNAAIIKKYLLLNFIFFLGGVGFQFHERVLICESVSGMASPRTTSEGMVVAVPEEGWPIDSGFQPSTHPTAVAARHLETCPPEPSYGQREGARQGSADPGSRFPAQLVAAHVYLRKSFFAKRL